MSTQPLILCADDYALSPGVSRGILEALDQRRINAASAMTNRPDWKSAAHDLAPFSDRADLGLHLNLTLGAPLGGMPKLAPGGELPKLGALLKAARSGKLPKDEVKAEIARQMDAFEEEMGRPPDFIDGHQHVQVFPGVRDCLFDEVVRRGYAGQTWLRDSSDHVLSILARRSEIAKALVLAWLGRGFAAEARGFGFAVNEGFAGFSSFDPKRDYARDFPRYLLSAGERHLVMCHPGHVDGDPKLGDEVTVTREKELAFFLSDEFATTLAKANMALERWSR